LRSASKGKSSGETEFNIKKSDRAHVGSVTLGFQKRTTKIVIAMAKNVAFFSESSSNGATSGLLQCIMLAQIVAVNESGGMPRTPNPGARNDHRPGIGF
jgi:hypothetical protein